MYLVKWEGYDDSENTWEPVDHLNCNELLEEFERNLKEKKEPRKLSARKRKRTVVEMPKKSNGNFDGFPSKQTKYSSNDNARESIGKSMKWPRQNDSDVEELISIDDKAEVILKPY